MSFPTCFQSKEIKLAVIWRNFSARRKMFDIFRVSHSVFKSELSTRPDCTPGRTPDSKCMENSIFFSHKLTQTAVFSKTRVISDYLCVSTPGMNFAKITKNFGWKPMEFSAECKEFDKNWENTTWQFRAFVNCKCTNFVNGIEKATIKSLSVRLSHVQNWLNVGSRKVGIAHF